MSAIDYAIIAVIVLSALVGLARGLVREALSLGTWIAALVLAWLFYEPVAALLTAQLSHPSLRIGVAFVALVLLGLLVGAILGALLSALVDRAGLNWADRLLGLAFGGARGALIVAMVVFLAALTPMPQDPWWSESRLIGDFQTIADWILSMVPPDIQAQLKQI